MAAGAVPPYAGRAIYRFEGFVLDLVRGALFDPRGAELRLRPKAYALLRHLVENAGRLIGRDEILAAVWPAVFVTEDSVTLRVRELRRALDDEGQRLLRTVPRREVQPSGESPAPARPAPAGWVPVPGIIGELSAHSRERLGH